MGKILFFSYSHADESFRNNLEKHLTILKRQGFIDTWHDRRIVAGDEVDGSISNNLEDSELILLLVSSDFLASSYCYDVEMSRALERHREGNARVIPVILRPCDWHDAPFGNLLAAPKDGLPVTMWTNIDEAFLDIVKAIKQALPSPPRPVAEPMPSGSAKAARETGQSEPRSSNLRVRKAFSEADKDKFLEESFSYMARFFENSLRELSDRNEQIEFRFRSIDANKFTAVVYRDGRAVTRCKIMFGGLTGRGISFSYNDHTGDNSFNESISVHADSQMLFLKPLGMPMRGASQEAQLSMEGAAEYYWSLFIDRIQ